MAGMMYGADAEELEQIAKELDGYESELGQLLLEGVGAVSLVGLSATLGAIWRGPRAGEFAGIWQSRHLLRLRDAQQILSTAAQDLRGNATEQRRTSANPPARLGLHPLFPGERFPFESVVRVLPHPHPANWLELFKGGVKFAELIEFLRAPVAGARPFYYALMGGARFGRFSIPGLTDIGMHLSKSDDAFAYFRGAKGGFRSAASKMGLLEKGIGRNLAFVGAGVSFASIAHTGVTEGFGSSEFAEALVDDGIGAAVGFVPGGGLAYEGGKAIGNVIYHHTPVGDFMLRSHESTQHISAAEDYSAQADAALKRGDFEAVHAANERAMEAARRAREESEGFKGLFNSTKSLFGL